MVYEERVIASSGQLPTLVEEAIVGLPGSALMLDVGAGDSRMSKALSSLRPDVRVVGLEYDAQLAFDATPDELKGRLIVGDARSLPFSGEAFESVAAVNILHEVINASDKTTRQAQLHSAIFGINRVLKQGGQLTIFDGLMPENKDEEVLVRAIDENAEQLLKQFRDEYVARPVSIEESDISPGTFKSDIASVVTFLTKHNYLKDGQAWEGERRQLYAFTDLGGILKALGAGGLELSTLQFPEPKARAGLASLLAKYVIIRACDGHAYTTATFPACQMLLTAQKTTSPQ